MACCLGAYRYSPRRASPCVSPSPTSTMRLTVKSGCPLGKIFHSLYFASCKIRETQVSMNEWAVIAATPSSLRSSRRGQGVKESRTGHAILTSPEVFHMGTTPSPLRAPSHGSSVVRYAQSRFIYCTLDKTINEQLVTSQGCVSWDPNDHDPCFVVSRQDNCYSTGRRLSARN